MSTASTQAVNELSTAVPSCSRIPDEVPDELCLDVLYNVLAKLPTISPIKDALRLKSLHPCADRAISRAISRNDHLRIDVREPAQYRIVGLKREMMKNPEPVIFVQGSRVNIDTAVTLVQYLLREMDVVRRLSIHIEDPDLTHLDRLLDEVLAAENVCLEVLQVQRRKGGQSLPKVAQLVRKHAKSLRIVGRIGLQEAADSFTPELKLDRLSLMTFDLGLDASSSRIFDHLASLIRSGASFTHLSYTSFVGFDPTDDVVQNLLDTCAVESLRLTMMKGPYIPPQPDYMVGKVRRINHLELGEVVEKPNIFNSLVTYEKTFQKVFPNVDDIHYFQQW